MRLFLMGIPGIPFPLSPSLASSALSALPSSGLSGSPPARPRASPAQSQCPSTAGVTVTRDVVTQKRLLPDWSGMYPVVSLSSFRCKHSNPHFFRRPCKPSTSPPLPSLELVVRGLLPPPRPALRPSQRRSLLTQRSSRSTDGYVPIRQMRDSRLILENRIQMNPPLPPSSSRTQLT